MTNPYRFARRVWSWLQSVARKAWLHAPRWINLQWSKTDLRTADTIADYMRDMDRKLLRENLKLSFELRAQKHLRALQMVEELRRQRGS